MRTMFGGKGNMVEGRIERIRVQNEDGTFASDRVCDIHNHIVDSGLDGIMTIGQFIDCTEANAIDYVKRYVLLALNKKGVAANDNTPDTYVKAHYAIYGRDNPLMPEGYESIYGLEENKIPVDIKVGDRINSNLITRTTNSDTLWYQMNYDGGLWSRMTFYLAIGTGTGMTMDYTESLDNMYIPSGGDPYSSSHYIPSSIDFSIRGTTPESAAPGDIHSTHRLTNNSVKATEPVDITEIGYFMAISSDYNSQVGWNSRGWSRGPMFSRILLDSPVHLEAGQRIVVTYAITEYAPYTGGVSKDANEYEIIYDLGLVDENGDPLQVMGSDEQMHTLGAIGRIIMCDGDCRTTWSRNASNAGSSLPSEGAFHSVAPTGEGGVMPCNSGYSRYSSSGYGSYSSIMSPYCECHRAMSVYGERYGYGGYTDSSCTRAGHTCICRSEVYAASNKKCSDGVSRGEGYYNDDGNDNRRDYSTGSDAFNGFPQIASGKVCSLLSTPWYIIYGSMFMPTGRSATMYSNPVPAGNIRTYSYSEENQTSEYFAPYKKGSFHRDMVIEIPCYYGNWNGTDTAVSSADPSLSSNIYWILIRNRMMYKIGYFTTPGNVDTFVQCGIPKKAGQVLRIRYREGIQRKLAE